MSFIFYVSMETITNEFCDGVTTVARLYVVDNFKDAEAENNYVPCCINPLIKSRYACLSFRNN